MCSARQFSLVAVVIAMFPTASQAGIIYDISMNTTPLISHSAGPFSLEFQLNDGSGTGNGNNTVVLSNFIFGGGSAVGIPTTNGGAIGDAGSSVTITDSSFFNQFIQQFTPGNQLGFRLSISTNVESGGTPDQFSFAILDSGGTELPTQSFFDVFVSIAIGLAEPDGSDVSNGHKPHAGGRWRCDRYSRAHSDSDLGCS